MYDVIVVGARCAGSPLAMLLARSGRRVLLVDRATFPSDTVSTHFVQQTGLARLQDWGILETAVGNATPFNRMTVSFKDLTITGHAEPIEGIDHVYAPRRTWMDAALLAEAERAGAEVRQDYTVEDLVVSDGRVVGIRGRSATGAVQDEHARVVIGADGANSTIAALVDAPMYKHQPASCFIYYSYFDGLDWNQFHHRTGWGEQQMGTWPTNDGQHLIAVMRKRGRFAEFRRDAEANFMEIIDQITPELAEDIRDRAVRTDPLRPMLYPDNYYRQASGAGWALVGDAGYHKDPYTGNGIADAFKHASFLAEALEAGLDASDAELDGELRGYGERRDEESAETYAFTCLVSELDLPRTVQDVFEASNLSDAYRQEFFKMMAGGMPGSEFFAPERVARMYADVDFRPTVDA